MLRKQKFLKHILYYVSFNCVMTPDAVALTFLRVLTNVRVMFLRMRDKYKIIVRTQSVYTTGCYVTFLR